MAAAAPAPTRSAAAAAAPPVPTVAPAAPPAVAPATAAPGRLAPGVVPVGRQPRTGTECYVTLVTSSDFVRGAVVLAWSLRRAGATYPLVVMVTPNLPASDRATLRACGYGVVEVRPIPNPAVRVHVTAWGSGGGDADADDSSSPGSDGACGFTKLRLWSLTQFSKCVYIDADCLVLRNCDELFARPDFAAAPDVYPPDRFNAGVLVVRPDVTVFQQLLHALATPDAALAYDGGDTGFLNALWSDWYGRPSSARLSFGYNALRTLHWMTARKQPGYWAAIQPLKIVHYCSSPKPWHTRAKGGELEHLYWRAEDQALAQLQFLADGPTPTPAPVPSAATTASPGPLPAALPIADALLTPPPPLNELLRGAAAVGGGGVRPPPRSWSERTHGVTFDGSNSKRAAPLKAGYWCAPPEREARVVDALRALYEAQRTRAPVGSTAATAAPAAAPAPGPAVLIPRVVHQIWLGGALPDRYKAWQSTWTRHLPQARGWTLKVWGDADLAAFPYSQHNRTHLRALMDSARTPVERSDVLRLDVLCAFGGLYVDTDFECLPTATASATGAAAGASAGAGATTHGANNADANADADDDGFEALHRRYAFYTGLSHTRAWEVNNGLIGAAPNHPVVRAAIDAMRLPKPPQPTDAGAVVAESTGAPSAYDILDRTGPGHFTRVVFRAALPPQPDATTAADAPTSAAAGSGAGSEAGAGAGAGSGSVLSTSNSIVLPLTYFYPFANTLRALPVCDRTPLYVRRESLAVHHWAGAWKPALAQAHAQARAAAAQQTTVADATTATAGSSSGVDMMALLQRLSSAQTPGSVAPPATAVDVKSTVAVVGSTGSGVSGASGTAKSQTPPTTRAGGAPDLAALAAALSGGGGGSGGRGGGVLGRIGGFLGAQTPVPAPKPPTAAAAAPAKSAD